MQGACPWTLDSGGVRKGKRRALARRFDSGLQRNPRNSRHRPAAFRRTALSLAALAIRRPRRSLLADGVLVGNGFELYPRAALGLLLDRHFYDAALLQLAEQD